VDLTSDVEYCGDCDVACRAQQDCLEGVCVCQGELVMCDLECFDVQTSREHCGECGHACVDMEICRDGVCTDEPARRRST
jgi:hypothetical protein